MRAAHPWDPRMRRVSAGTRPSPRISTGIDPESQRCMLLPRLAKANDAVHRSATMRRRVHHWCRPPSVPCTFARITSTVRGPDGGRTGAAGAGRGPGGERRPRATWGGPPRRGRLAQQAQRGPTGAAVPQQGPSGPRGGGAGAVSITGISRLRPDELLRGRGIATWGYTRVPGVVVILS